MYHKTLLLVLQFLTQKWRASIIRQGYLEASNVQIVEEMVNPLLASAYELNSKAITTSDEMMGIANNLKR